MADKKYLSFHSGLVPGIHDFLGIRIPELRKLGKELAPAICDENSWQSFLSDVPALYEEVMLRGILIGLMPVKYIPTPENEAFFNIILSQIEYIDNWALCDCFCSGLKQKRLLDDTFFENCRKRLILNGDSIWHIRTGLIMLLSHFITERFISQVLSSCTSAVDRLCEFDYDSTFYVRMGIAWLLAECYIKFPDEAYGFMFGDSSHKNISDDWTFNKAIQKINESLRVSDEHKAELKKLKRTAGGSVPSHAS